MTNTAQESSPDRQIGENIAATLFRVRLKQQQLAHGIGMTPATLSRRMLGQQAWLFWEVQAIAEFFGLSLDELSGELPPFVSWRDEIVSGTPSGTRTPNPLIRSHPRFPLVQVSGNPNLPMDRTERKRVHHPSCPARQGAPWCIGCGRSHLAAVA